MVMNRTSAVAVSIQAVSALLSVSACPEVGSASSGVRRRSAVGNGSAVFFGADSMDISRQMRSKKVRNNGKKDDTAPLRCLCSGNLELFLLRGKYCANLMRLPEARVIVVRGGDLHLG
jgi:hypothetical protein